MFVKSNDLIDFVNSIKDEKSFYDWFFEDYVFGVYEKDTINNYKEKYNEHREILTEVISDYTLDFQFLNAYKHGYRVRANTNEQVYTLRTPDGVAVPFAKFDSVLTYFSKERDPNNHQLTIVYENTLAFNLKRVVIKSMCLSAVLENIQKMIVAQTKPNKEVKLTHFYFTDKEVWQKSYGNGRLKSDIFFLKKQQKS